MDIEQIWREEWGRLMALLVARTRRLDLAEDALADAFEAAARTWPGDGTPRNPPAWLLTAARRRVTDRIRAEAIAMRKQRLLVVEQENRAAARDDDGLLRLALLSAHPALAPEAGAALTLRLVMGISTADIARLFLVSTSTMAARLTRARTKVVAAGIPFALPSEDELPGRLEVIADVAYLAFTAGYAPGSGPDVLRADLAGEAIRLVRLLRASSPAAEASDSLVALEALMLLQHSRRDARVDPDGRLVTLPEQDRGRWHHDEISAGLDLTTRLTGQTPRSTRISVHSRPAAEYLLQALIAAEHARAPTATDTDWPAIASLYRQLDDLTGSPIVRLNRAVAVAEAGDAEAALALIDTLDARLPHSHRPAAVRADLLARLGRPAQAHAQYTIAIERCASDAERDALQRAAAGVVPADLVPADPGVSVRPPASRRPGR